MLTETGVNTGIFRNTTALPSSTSTGLQPEDGTLNAAAGDSISASHTDPLFGDVCTALVVEAADTATAADRWQVLGTKLVTQFSNNIRNNAGFMNRCEDTDPDARDKTFRQEGRKVFKEVVPIEGR